MKHFLTLSILLLFVEFVYPQALPRSGRMDKLALDTLASRAVSYLLFNDTTRAKFFVRMDSTVTPVAFGAGTGVATLVSKGESGFVWLTPSGTVMTFSGTGLVAADSVSIRNYSNALYLKNADSTSIRNYSNSLYALQATTITVAGTANQITSSAGAQSLAANRTWTLSTPQDIATTSTPQFLGVGLGTAAVSNKRITFSNPSITTGSGALLNQPSLFAASVDAATTLSLINLSKSNTATSGSSYFWGINGVTADSTVDYGGFLGITNSGRADAIYINNKGVNGSPTNNNPTALGIDLNWDTGSTENSPTYGGQGIQIYDRSTTSLSGINAIYLKKQNNMNSESKMLKIEANRRALDIITATSGFVAGASMISLMDTTNTTAQWGISARGDGSYASTVGQYFNTAASSAYFRGTASNQIDMTMPSSGMRWLNNAGSVANLTFSDAGVMILNSTTGMLGINMTPVTVVDIASDSINVGSIRETRYQNSATASPTWNIRTGRGTIASGLPIQSGDRIGGLVYGGISVAPSTFINSIAITGYAEEAFSSGVGGSQIRFETSKIGASARTQSMTITANGNVLVGATAAGTSAVGVFGIKTTTAPSAAITDGTQLYNRDAVAGAREAFMLNETTDETRLTGLTATVTTQFDKTNTTLANITMDNTINVEAGKTYSFRAVLYTTSNVAGGVKAAMAGTATATTIVYEGFTTAAGAITQTRASALGTEVGAVTAVTAANIIIEGTIIVNGAGTLVPQFACNAAVGTSSVLVGSIFTIQQR